MPSFIKGALLREYKDLRPKPASLIDRQDCFQETVTNLTLLTLQSSHKVSDPEFHGYTQSLGLQVN